MVVIDSADLILRVAFSSKDPQQRLRLDNLTSYAIMLGGTVKGERQTLDLVSPYLAQRVIGGKNWDLQVGIKQVFDPKDVLSPSNMWPIREEKSKSWKQKAMEWNK